MYKHICKTCGKEFQNKKQNSLFCSRECYTEYIKKNGGNKKERHLIEVTCAECGKTEYVMPSRAKHYLCCSVECLGKYNSKKYTQKVTLVCPICGKEYQCKPSKIKNYRTCGNPDCTSLWLSRTRAGKKNGNYKTVADVLKEVRTNNGKTNKDLYRHVVKEILGLNSISEIPKGYVVHHKDANHNNNDPENLVVLPKTVHRLIHIIFGNVLIHGLHTGIIDAEIFKKMCTNEQWDFYKNIMDLNVTRQAVVKQGELLERPEEENQHPSIYRNIIEGSTTNEQVLTDNAEDGNFDTSALPNKNIGDEIV